MLRLVAGDDKQNGRGTQSSNQTRHDACAHQISDTEEIGSGALLQDPCQGHRLRLPCHFIDQDIRGLHGALPVTSTPTELLYSNVMITLERLLRILCVCARNQSYA